MISLYPVDGTGESMNLFQVTCEYGYDFWKTVTFPFLEVE
jgi:hypothetical protein